MMLDVLVDFNILIPEFELGSDKVGDDILVC